jgi:hypothetical protein
MCMKHVILVLTAIATCVAATQVPVAFVPLVVTLALGAFMVLHGILAAPRRRHDDDLDVTQPLPQLRSQRL